MNDATMLDHALGYAADGLPVFPLIPGTKRPATAHGKDDATTGETQIRAWWTATPNANIAVRVPDWAVVLDVDTRNGGTLEALAPLPDTLTFHTGGGGWHLWFDRPDGDLRGQLDGIPGVDIKTSTGYVVMPPSVHPNGERYVDPGTGNMIETVPEHLVARMVKPTRTVRTTPRPSTTPPPRGYWAAALQGELDAIATAPEGTRNETLNRAAFNLGTLIAAAGEHADDVTALLAAAAAQAGLEEWEADGTIRSGLTAGMDQPRSIPERDRETTRTATSANLATSSGLNETPHASGSSAVLDELRDHLARYVCTVTDGDLDLLTLWIAHTHVVFETYTTPRLLLDSPMPGSGKTTVLEHCNALAFKPMMAASLSSSAMLARALEHEPRTVLVDEADRSLDPKHEGTAELLAVINSGYKRGGQRPTLVPSKENGWELKELSTFGPVAMAGNSPNLPEDTMQRCIRVLLFPDLEETVEETDWELIEAEVGHLADRLAAWADTIRDTIRTTRPTLPAGVKGRNREKWGPLKRVAATAGGHWPATVDELALADLEQQRDDREAGLTVDKPHVRLLRNLAEVWPTDVSGTPRAFVPTEEIITRLSGTFPEDWGHGSPFGKPVTPHRMGRMLGGNYRVKPTRPDSNGPRGYAFAALQTIWGRLQITPPGEPDELAEVA